MKITVEHTDNVSMSSHGIGRVWTGTTEQGTPVKVLICGIKPGSDDPALEAQFEREHDAIPDLPPQCPDCGEPIEGHKLLGQATIDLYEVAARWLIGYGDARVANPEGISPSEIARGLREKLPKRDKDYHDALMDAARSVATYVVGEIMAAQGVERLDKFSQATVPDVGHA